MNILNHKESNIENDTDPVYFFCNFCFYNSKNYMNSSKTLDQLQKDNIGVANLAT